MIHLYFTEEKIQGLTCVLLRIKLSLSILEVFLKVSITYGANQFETSYFSVGLD